MCGLVGIVAFDQDLAVSSDELRLMLAQIAHRGPDGSGTHIHADPSGGAAVALGHCRLAILDPAGRSDQPWTDQQGRWIIFNGEIYNFRELRKELDPWRNGRPWRTQGDTEVLLAAYAQWGVDCVQHLDGMFALAIWDAPNQTLFLARDRMGQKPLYFATFPNFPVTEGAIRAPLKAVAVASELSALREVNWIDRSIDDASLMDYLCWGYVPDPRTIYRGIQQLPPGTWAGCDAHGLKIAHYFDPAEGLEIPSADNLSKPAAPLSTLIHQAVRRQLVSDVPVGCFLSGGIDSSVIAAAMCDVLGDPAAVHTFSIGFEDPRYDESSYAQEVARHLGTTHHTFVVRPDAAADLPKLVRVFGQPFADSSALAVHYLSQQTRREVKVALSGDGGDELFGGYDRYRAAAWIEKLPRGLRRLMAHRLGRHLPGAHPKSMLTRLKRLLASADRPLLDRYAGYMRLFDDATLDALLDGPVESQSLQSTDRHWLLEQGRQLAGRSGWNVRDPVALVTALDRLTYLPYDLLTKLDRASMLHALEVRSPFMDPSLVRFAASLAGRQLIGGGPKRPLRQAFADRLPPAVFDRRKMGFALPLGQWFRGPLRSMLADLLFAANSFTARHLNTKAVRGLIQQHESRRIDYSQRLYALLMLELWWREN